MWAPARDRLTAEFDPHLDEGMASAERFAEAGVRVARRTWGGTIHGFVSVLQEASDLEAAHGAMDLIAEDLAESFGR